MGFIHGEVNWRDRPDAVRTAVATMAGATARYPWAASTTWEASGGRATVVATVQNATDTAVHPPPGARTADVAGHVHLAADLRLDGRAELARQLRIRAGEVGTVTDHELVLLAYARWGTRCVEHLIGDGAFALWDERDQRLLCWRDVAGVRPLYYRYEPGGRFVFSSDLAAIAAHPATSGTLDLAYTRAQLEIGHGFQHPSRTLVHEVWKLPARHCVTVDAAGFHVRPYWRPEPATRTGRRHAHDYADELRELLRRATADRLPDDGRGVGAHLSGGLDSSSIAVVAARELRTTAGGELTAFSWAPSWDTVPEIEDDERHLADAVARANGLRLRFADLHPTDLLDIFERDLALRPTHTLHYELATTRDAAQLGITTMLSGWGGDELAVFNGRGYFADLARRGRWRTLHRELRGQQAVQGGSLRGAVRSRVLKPLLPASVNQRLGWQPPPRPAVLPAELRPEFRHQLARVEPLEQRDLRERPGVHRMQRSLLTDGHLQYRMESWASHGATCGITYAYPLLDRRLIEFALRIPDHLYFRDGWKRWLYRTAMEGVLPDEVRWHPIKHDEAMAVQYRQVEPTTVEPYFEHLRRRRDNPFIDIDPLLPGWDGAAPAAPVGGASWMAFTSLGAP